MAKIKEEQLKEIVELQGKLGQILSNIGVLESQKHGLLHDVAAANKELEDFKAKLEEEYGAISVDLSTGEYTEVKEEEAKKEE